MVDSSNFFYLNILLFKFGGLWVPERSEPSHKYKFICYIFNTICVGYSIAFFTISQLVVLPDSSQSRSILIKNLNMASSFLVSSHKVVMWFYWRKDILTIMKTLQGTLHIFDKFEDFDPEALVKKRKKLQENLVKIFQSLSWAVSSSCMISRIIEVSFYGEKYEVYSNVTGYSYNRELPYQSWIPFDQTASRMAHLGAVFMQCLAIFSCGAITVGLDMMYVALVMFTSVHFELLQGAFKTIRQKCARRLNKTDEYINDPPELVAATEAELKKYIVHLQTILKICKSLEDIYCYLILTQLSVSLVVVCTCLFLVSSVPVGTTFMGNDLAYLMAGENELALYCYTANELTQNGLLIPQSLYDGDWLSTSKKYKNYILFTMMRMGKPVYLTIGKFMPLTLSTFVTIGRASYSLLAILKR